MDQRIPIYESGKYSSSMVRLYGLPVDTKGKVMNLGGLQIEVTSGPFTCRRQGDPKAKLEAAIIFAYAYQGHCYELPKPKGMLLEAAGQNIQDGDCGYGAPTGYKVWVVDKLHRGIEVEISEGEVEELVLEANRPGKRSPTTYRAAMQVAHRSGRLTE
jgi:hypothetical protein